jgi:phosphoglucomutase
MLPATRSNYQLWSTDPYFDEATRRELLSIANDPNDVEERFYKDLEFGTGGLRGLIGAGLNRMNVYTVAKASEGFARYLLGEGEDFYKRGVVISYDSRLYSDLFAQVTAQVFATHGIPAYLSDELRPTPMLSFAVRRFGAVGGVMVTASHNPAKYNGYKAYGEDGGQLPPEAADKVLAAIRSIDDIRTVRWIGLQEAESQGLVRRFGKEIDEAYMAALKPLSIDPGAISRQAGMKIVYTPLHGAGNKPVRRILSELGFHEVVVVPEQEMPDSAFPTVAFPNPEERTALQMAIDLAGRENADLVIATDPDGDRMGIAVRDEDDSFSVLTGNQIGLLLMEYVLSAKKAAGTLPPGSFAVTTIVSTQLAEPVGEAFGVEVIRTLTGFKFIGEKIRDLDENGTGHFQFGFEESFGYLCGTEVRDKDAVVASMLFAEMAAVCRDTGTTIRGRLKSIFHRFGYAAEDTVSITLEGKEGITRIAGAMSRLRSEKDQDLRGIPVLSIDDYGTLTRTVCSMQTTPIEGFTSSDVLRYTLAGLDWFCVRPSGTEPKLKIYFGCYDPDETAARSRLASLSDSVVAHIRERLQ